MIRSHDPNKHKVSRNNYPYKITNIKCSRKTLNTQQPQSLKCQNNTGEKITLDKVASIIPANLFDSI